MLTPRQQLAAGIIIAFSNLMVILDLTIANVSVPHVAGDLGITLEQGTWIITSYAVAEAICVPLSGWLANRFGTVRTFVYSMFGFGVFSLACGLSPTLGVLVAARIGQGVCGAPIMPLSQTLMMRIFPPERRTQAMAVWAMTTLIGPALGPILGGYISDNFSWHWIFLINVPIAVVCVMAAAYLLRPVETPTTRQPIDKVGMALLVFWIGCLQIMLDIGRDHDWFEDWKIVALAAGALVGFIAFVIWELTDEHPAVDLRIFRHKGFSATLVTMTLAFGAYFAGIVAIPQWLQTALGYSAQQAGLATAWTAITAMMVMPLAVRIISRIDPRLSISLAVGWMGMVAVLRALDWTSQADLWTVSWPQMAMGLSLPFFMVPLTVLSLAWVKADEMASAAGLQNFLRTLSIAVATSLVLTIWNNSQREAHNEIANVLNPGTTENVLVNSGFGTEQARVLINGLVDSEAMILALNHTFMIAAAVTFFAAIVVWVSPKPKGGMAMQAGGH